MELALFFLTYGSPWGIAKFYQRQGWCVLPSGGGPAGKSPLISWKAFENRLPTKDELEQWHSQLHPDLWGLVTGKVSSIFVIDADDSPAKTSMETAGFQPHVETPRGGAHFYFKHPGFDIRTVAGLLPGIDCRGDGGFINLIGTRRDGEYVIIRPPLDSNIYSFDQLPAKLQTALQPKSKEAVFREGAEQTTTLAEPILKMALDRVRPGSRNDTGLWLGVQLRDNGLSEAQAEMVMLRYARRVRDLSPEPYTESEAIASLHQAFSRAPRAPWSVPNNPTSVPGAAIFTFNLTDFGNAERLVRQYGDILHYCYERKQWLYWDGKVWQWDTGAKITELAKFTVRSIYREAANEPDEKRRKEIADHAHRSESDHRISSMINLAQSEPGIPVKLSELDADHFLFNCLNGTIDLRKGSLLPHRKEDLLSVIVPIEYNPEAQAPLWGLFLDRVTGGDAELAGYLQRAVGYSLTGDTKYQVIFFLYGLGQNGKTTFTMTIRKVCADYGARINIDALMTKEHNSGPREEVANLKGKRYVLASELEENRKLSVSVVKDLTGNESLLADRKYEHFFEFPPTHKLWLYGNHKPIIPDTTLSIWRRVKLIPFTVTIPEEEKDPDLPEKLEKELPGILSWAVRGCLNWRFLGLEEPEVVTRATSGYRREQDILGDFLDDCCVLEQLSTTPLGDLKNAYQVWCQENGVEPINQKTFKARLAEKEVVQGRGWKGRFWQGIRLRTENDSGRDDKP